MGRISRDGITISPKRHDNKVNNTLFELELSNFVATYEIWYQDLTK